MINARILKNGSLKLTADNHSRHDLAYALSQGYDCATGYVAEELHERYAFVNPEDVGALTSAPMLVNADAVEYTDDGRTVVASDAQVWWFSDYAIRHEWEELARKGRVVFQAA